MADSTALRLYRKRLREVLASIAAGERDLRSIHAQISAEIIAKLRTTADNANALQLEQLFAAEFERTAFKRVRLTKALIEQGAKAGPKAMRETLREAFGDELAPAQVRTSAKALKQAGERIAGRVTVDGVSQSKRIRRVDRETAQEMAGEVQRGIRQRKGILGAARKIEKLDRRPTQLPQYLADLESAARSGNVSEVKALAKRYLERVKRMGEWQPDGTFKASKYSLRSATQRFVRDVQKASSQGIDKIVQQYVTEKAAWRANVIARHETVSAFRQSYVEQAKGKPGVVAMQWRLSGRHPRKDECDLFANQNAYGLGPGVYPSDKLPKHPHPMCLCAITSVMDRKHFQRAESERGKFPDDMRDEKSPDAVGWLHQNDAAARAILGPTRYELFKSGTNVLDAEGRPRLVRELLPGFERAAE
jgi:hypothetical protein